MPFFSIPVPSILNVAGTVKVNTFPALMDVVSSRSFVMRDVTVTLTSKRAMIVISLYSSYSLL